MKQRKNTETENHNDPISENKKDEFTPEDKIKELEDKLSRTLAEMENQKEDDLKKKKKMLLNMVGFYLQKRL